MEATGGFEPPIKVLQTSALATWPCRHICGAQTRIWTTDTGIFSPLLYRLSYLGILTKFLWLKWIQSRTFRHLHSKLFKCFNDFLKRNLFRFNAHRISKMNLLHLKKDYRVIMAGVTRFELATSCVTGKHSNQLSYTPIILCMKF